jgi:protein TonB
MNRLQKKCVMATAGFHLLLLVILFVGPAFFWSHEKPDDTPVLDMIPSILIDEASTGVRGAEPPPPAPAPVVEPPQPTPTPPAPAPTPVVEPPAPVPTPDKIEPVKPPKETVKPKAEPVEKPTATKPAPPKINLVPTTHVVPNTSTTTKTAPAPDNSKAIKSALRALRNNLSSSTTINMPGNSSAAAANYAQVVKSVYEQAWTPPDDTSSDDADIKVRVTIGSDGSVISARIISPSGDAKVDRSVRGTLERVQFIAPFPSGTSDKERTYIINFNLKSKRLLG